MVKPIANILPGINPIPSVPGAGGSSGSSGGTNFGEVLNQAIDSVSQMQNNASEIGNLFAAGKIDDLHTMMIESEKADLALQFTLQVRNKIMDAYTEIMRMPL